MATQLNSNIPLAHMAMMGSLWLWDFTCATKVGESKAQSGPLEHSELFGGGGSTARTRLAPSAEALASGRSSLVSQLSQCLGVHIGLCVCTCGVIQ